MTILKITAIVRPLAASSGIPTEVTPREFDAVDEFVALLAKATHIAIPVVEGTLENAPGEGLIIVFDAVGIADYPELGPRIILLNADRSRVPGCLEELHLFAAVEKHRYFQWKRQRDKERGAGLFGRKDVAERMGAVVAKAFASQRYGILSSDECPDLPQLLAAYIGASSAAKSHADR